MANNVAEILKQLDQLSIEEHIPVYVPSIKQTVKFKTLNLKQQKELLKTSIDESLIKLAFNVLITDIIKENIIDSIDTSRFFTFDRNAIALTIRTKALDNKYKIDDKEFDLNTKVNDIPNIPLDISKLTTTITDNNLQISLQGPNLKSDKELNTYAIGKFKSAPSDDIKTVIGDIVVYELIKFIQKVVYKQPTGESLEIVLDTIPVKERVSIVEKLPTSITNKIFDFIKQYRDIENQYNRVDDQIIDIDGNFFTV